ncbi:helix-turn-helix domain-containing protein [Salinibaculum salinum]|uniref:winged helix-turn-helix transcriptional regulator n=1 Tax=Salinibaculum salinum TaxID=3131996 RepID=UPI0030EF3419
MTERTTDDCASNPPIPGEYDGGHPATELFSLLGRSHAMAILFYVVREEQRPWRFSELEETLGISPNTLSSRLEELVEGGLLERRSYDEIPPRVEYEATQRALDLDPIFRELYEWAKEHGEETELVHGSPE